MKSRRVVAKVKWHPNELYPCIGFIVTNLVRSAERVVTFYSQRGTAEQWIKEGKGAIKWTRLSCRSFAANAVPKAGSESGRVLAIVIANRCGGNFRRQIPVGRVAFYRAMAAEEIECADESAVAPAIAQAASDRECARSRRRPRRRPRRPGQPSRRTSPRYGCAQNCDLGISGSIRSIGASH
jgi:Transposase DDE domain group 1